MLSIAIAVGFHWNRKCWCCCVSIDLRAGCRTRISWAARRNPICFYIPFVCGAVKAVSVAGWNIWQRWVVWIHLLLRGLGSQVDVHVDDSLERRYSADVAINFISCFCERWNVVRRHFEVYPLQPCQWLFEMTCFSDKGCVDNDKKVNRDPMHAIIRNFHSFIQKHVPFFRFVSVMIVRLGSKCRFYKFNMQQNVASTSQYILSSGTNLVSKNTTTNQIVAPTTN